MIRLKMGLLRLVLAMAVVYFHLATPYPGFKSFGPQVAVQTFFVISGFYMTLVLNEKYLPRPGIYWVFIKNRLLRLYPTYFLIALGTAAALFLLVATGRSNPLIELWSGQPVAMTGGTKAFLTFIHFSLVGQDLPIYLALSPDGSLHWTANFWKEPYPIWSYLLNPPAWSLSLELMFYAIAPWIVRRPLKQIIPIILLTIALRFFLFSQYGLEHDPWSYRFFPVELGTFLLGTVAYHLYKFKLNSEWIKGKERWIVVGAVSLLMALPYFPNFNPLVAPFLMTLMIPFVFSATKSNPRDRNIGELSYPVYISHWPILKLLKTLNYLHVPEMARFPFVAALTLLVSWLIYHYMDEPIERYRQKLVLRSLEKDVLKLQQRQ